MNDNEILKKINQFDRWHYQFELGSHTTPIFDEGHINRHNQRKSYFFDALVKSQGGSLTGKRVLDLGCNAGFWSLAAIENGCEYVLGVDGRLFHIDQANFVFEVNNISKERFDFKQGNVFEFIRNDLGSFDIVLFLGLMYHISKPITLLELISEVNSDVLVIDTLINKRKKSILEIRHESLDEPRNAFDYELAVSYTHLTLPTN